MIHGTTPQLPLLQVEHYRRNEKMTGNRELSSETQLEICCSCEPSADRRKRRLLNIDLASTETPSPIIVHAVSRSRPRQRYFSHTERNTPTTNTTKFPRSRGECGGVKSSLTRDGGLVTTSKTRQACTIIYGHPLADRLQVTTTRPLTTVRTCTRNNRCGHRLLRCKQYWRCRSFGNN